MPSPRPVIFHGPRQWYHADTCRPLEEAAKAGKVRLQAVGHPPYPCVPMANRLLPELRTLGYWDARDDQRWGLDWHRNEGIEFTYLARGQVNFAVDGCDYHLRHGHLTITRPWQRHRVGTPHVTASRLHWLILDVGMRRPNQPWRWPDWLILSAAELSRLTRLLRYNEHPVWRADPHIGSRFEMLSGLCDDAATKIDATRLKLCINELLLELLDLLTSKNIALDQSLTSTLRQIELFLAGLRHHLDHPWTVDDMAGHCGLGRTRFAHYCRQITNLSPLEYLTRLRIDAAETLLRTRPEMTVTQVAMASGFSSSQYFATVFRQHTGRAPRECRE